MRVANAVDAIATHAMAAPRCHLRTKMASTLPVAGEPNPLNAPTKTAKPCPICGKPHVERFRPFCSRRCADIDLHRWLGGTYAIPAAEQDDNEAGEAGPGEDQSH
jgi:endogenous inhibitor of DNA gyrase (YacG/DUF329 family)